MMRHDLKLLVFGCEIPAALDLPIAAFDKPVLIVQGGRDSSVPPRTRA
jgi:hypothetical protein